jgi:glutamyl-tRNA synthetase
MIKLLDVSKNVISKFTAEKIYNETLEWAKNYDEELKRLLENHQEYSLKVLNIERGNAKPRKDISKWSEVKGIISYMYDEVFENNNMYEFQKITGKDEIKEILSNYLEKYFDISDDKQTWFDKIKDLAEEKGYAREVKEYKQNPEKYKGHVGDISTVIRVALTGKCNTPDLYEIIQILGKERVEERINRIN